MNLAGILVCIVIVFLFCHVPRIILNCAEFLMTNSIIACPDFSPPAWFHCLTRYIIWLLVSFKQFFSFMHLLLIINASSNFLIYCFMGNMFKEVLRLKIKSLHNLFMGKQSPTKETIPLFEVESFSMYCGNSCLWFDFDFWGARGLKDISYINDMSWNLTFLFNLLLLTTIYLAHLMQIQTIGMEL